MTSGMYKRTKETRKKMSGTNHWNYGNRKGKKIPCEICSKLFYVMPCFNKITKTCSKECYKEWRSKYQKENPNKQNFKKGQKAWNKGLKGLRWQNVSTMIDYNKKHSVWNKGKKRPEISGKNHWNYGSKMSEEHKDKFFKGQKKYLEENGSWCKGKKLSQEHRKKLKEARKYQIMPIKDTKIELKVQDFLTSLKIEFFTHKYINIKHGYQCDILIPVQNGIIQKIIIECDGDFFHCNPNKFLSNDKCFKNGITAKERWELDDTRTEELIDKGFQVLRLWEHEIKVMDINTFKNKLIGRKQ